MLNDIKKTHPWNNARKRIQIDKINFLLDAMSCPLSLLTFVEARLKTKKLGQDMNFVFSSEELNQLRTD